MTDFTSLLKAFTWPCRTSAVSGDIYFFGTERTFFVWMSEIWTRSSAGNAEELCDLGRSHGRWWPPWFGWGTGANRALCFNYSMLLGLLLRKTTENFIQGRRKLLGRPWCQLVRFFKVQPKWTHTHTHTHSGGPPYPRVVCSKTYRGYVKQRIIPNAIHNMI